MRLPLLLLSLLLLIPWPASGQPLPPAAEDVVGVDDDTDEIDSVEEEILLAEATAPDAGQPLPTTAAPPIPGVVIPPEDQDDLFERGKEAYEALQMARRAPTVGAVAAAIAAGIILLIALARRFGGLLLKPDQVAKFVLFASALAGGVAEVSDGMHWLEIATITVMPILAVGFHQTVVKPFIRARAAARTKRG